MWVAICAGLITAVIVTLFNTSLAYTPKAVHDDMRQGILFIRLVVLAAGLFSLASFGVPGLIPTRDDARQLFSSVSPWAMCGVAMLNFLAVVGLYVSLCKGDAVTLVLININVAATIVLCAYLRIQGRQPKPLAWYTWLGLFAFLGSIAFVQVSRNWE